MQITPNIRRRSHLSPGAVISRVRSGGYGYTLAKNILYAYLPVDLAITGTMLEVDLLDGRMGQKSLPPCFLILRAQDRA